jgi:hypothetical protein
MCLGLGAESQAVCVFVAVEVEVVLGGFVVGLDLPFCYIYELAVGRTFNKGAVELDKVFGFLWFW